MAKLINLTPHAIRIRLEASDEAFELDTDIVINPEPEEGVYYLVSMPLALQAAALGRNTDVRYPDTGKDTIRLNGQPFAVRRLLMAKIAK